MRSRARNGDGQIDNSASNVCKKADANGYTEAAGANPAIGITFKNGGMRSR